MRNTPNGRRHQCDASLTLAPARALARVTFACPQSYLDGFGGGVQHSFPALKGPMQKHSKYLAPRNPVIAL